MRRLADIITWTSFFIVCSGGNGERGSQFSSSVGVNRYPFQGCQNVIPPPPSSAFHFQPYFASGQSPVLAYRVNLDIAPDRRWQDLIAGKKKEMRNLIETMRARSDELFGKEVFKMIDTLMPYLTSTLPSEYYQELVGISTVSELTVGEITLYNIFYEFYSLCTSIVMEDSQGHMYHGRNLDFGFLLGWDIKNKTWLMSELLRPLIVKVEFWKNEQPLYSSVSFVGYIGILTGVKKNRFSLSINERFKVDGGYIGIIEWIYGRRNQKWLGVLTREVMENAADFKDAQKMLSLPKLIAPSYFIIAGNKAGQGSVITRSRTESDIWNIAVDKNQTRGAWYLVQTNYDHWKKPPAFDDRTTPAVTCMEQLGRRYPFYTLYNVLSTIPVLNKLTVYTAIMDVSEGRLDVWIQNCANPCWPW